MEGKWSMDGSMEVRIVSREIMLCVSLSFIYLLGLCYWEKGLLEYYVQY